MMLEQPLSDAVKKALKKGDFDGFMALVNTHNIQAASHLYAKRESTAWPLLQVVLDNPFSNSNCIGRLKIAHYLVENGGNINDLRPYGASALYSFLQQHYYLKDTNAKYEIYVQTLIFALALVRQDSIDVNASARATSFGILDSAVYIQKMHATDKNEELAKIAAQICLELLAKGAKTREK